MYTFARKFLVSVSGLSVSLSLSLCLSSLRNQDYPWIVSECVSSTEVGNLADTSRQSPPRVHAVRKEDMGMFPNPPCVVV